MMHRKYWLLLGCIIAVGTFAAYQTFPTINTAKGFISSAQMQEQSSPASINSSPLFDSPKGWSPGFTLAAGHGLGVVVGPGADNPNVFAQLFPAKPNEQFKVVAKASSVSQFEAMGRIQINWTGEKGEFISVSSETFAVTPQEKAFQHYVTAPPGAVSGTLYVAPGGAKDVVRYTEMALFHLNFRDDFSQYRLLGIEIKNLLVLGSLTILFVALYFTGSFRKAVSLFGKTVNQLMPFFPVIAIALCGAVFLVLEIPYELNVDSHWHEANAEAIMRWNDFSLNLGANPLYNFGIQLPMNPLLSPTYWIGEMVTPDHRIQIQGAFQCMVFWGLFVWFCRTAGAKLMDASAIGLIAAYFMGVPNLGGGAITFQAVLGLLWQEAAIAALFAIFCFSLIGSTHTGKSVRFWPAIGLASIVVWFFVAYPALAPFYILTVTGLCLGALIGSKGKSELVHKLLVVVLLIATLFIFGFHNYILNLFLFTPQMYYGVSAPDSIYSYLFFNNTSILLYKGMGGSTIILFYILALMGAFFAYRLGNGFARKIVIVAITFEITIFVFSALNFAFHALVISFFYIELMGIAVVALLAATACWVILRYGVAYLQQKTSMIYQPLPYLLLLCITSGVIYWSSEPHIWSGDFSVWPPKTNNEPARILIKELAIQPGQNFKGRGAVIVGMNQKTPAGWHEFGEIVGYKYRRELGNDLFIDAMADDIPMVNEYGHWTSPPMLALQATALGRPDDYVSRAAHALREFRPNLARLIGVSLAVSDKPLPEETKLYHGIAHDHPLYIHRIAGANLGQYSPIRTIVATDAKQILAYLQAPDFDGQQLAIIEKPLESNLVPASQVAVSIHKGPKLHIEADSAGVALLVLPFEYSHCLEASGAGLHQLIPVNLAQVGLVVEGKISLDITYQYGVLKGTSCRQQDLARVRELQLKEAAIGRIFNFGL